MIPQYRDRLKIFVSSTIEECAPERAAARAGIESTNHEPVLFEMRGARPHPAREEYQTRLEMSQVFVGIYRESYGWIAPGMSVSGVEDEFDLATSRGMDRLIYVFKPGEGRDPRLSALIARARGGLTTKSYSTPEELRALVRDDLTAVVSMRFTEQLLATTDAASAEDVLNAIVPNPRHRIRRHHVERQLVEALNSAGRLVVTAPLGGGKTVTLAQLSVANGWLFVDGQTLSHVDLMARITNSLRVRGGLGLATFSSEDVAKRELQRLWDSQDVTLVVDGADNTEALWRAIPLDRRLVVTSRSPLEAPSSRHFPLPEFSDDEVAAWVAAWRGSPADPGEVTRLTALSSGHPLYLRYYALGGSSSDDLTLQQLEIRAVEALPPQGKEVTTYLALWNGPFTLRDLQSLVGTGDSPEIIAQHVSSASGLLRQTRGQLQLFHEHLRQTILDQLRQAPARRAFFADRLGRHLEAAGRFVAAFHVYQQAEERRHADRVTASAANQAALFAAGSVAIPVLARAVELADEGDQPESRIGTRLALSAAQAQAGEKASTRSTLAAARRIAEEQGEADWLLRIREAEILFDVFGKTRAERVGELTTLKTSYRSSGSAFNSARMSTLLAEEYIFGHDPRSAARESREALDVFREIGDDYGIRIARLNLAAALSGLDDGKAEAAAIVRDLDREIDPDESPRERSVLCNVLARHYRNSGNGERAAEFAREAIEIGEQLGSPHVIATNRIVLGNIHRDSGRLDSAVGEYRAADAAAVNAGLKSIECAANELIASVLNQRGQFGPALHHAQHAVTLASDLLEPVLIARTEEERGWALAGQRSVEQALSAYAAAAKAMNGFRPGGGYFVSLLSDALSLCASEANAELTTGFFRQVFELSDQSDGSDDRLRQVFNVIRRMSVSMRPEDVFPLSAAVIGLVFRGLPAPLERAVVLRAIDAIGSEEDSIVSRSGLAAVAAILATHKGDSLELWELGTLNERLAASSPNLYFKAQTDGAAHWTVRMEVGGGILVTVLQLDDNARSAYLTTALALFLGCFDGLVGRELLGSESLPRSEVTIHVAARSEIERNLGPSTFDFGEMSRGYAVARSSDPTHSDQPPIFVVRTDSFPQQWLPTTDRLSDVHLLFAELLPVIAAHLLGRVVEADVLLPKVKRIVQRIAFTGDLPGSGNSSTE